MNARQERLTVAGLAGAIILGSGALTTGLMYAADQYVERDRQVQVDRYFQQMAHEYGPATVHGDMQEGVEIYVSPTWGRNEK